MWNRNQHFNFIEFNNNLLNDLLYVLHFLRATKIAISCTINEIMALLMQKLDIN